MKCGIISINDANYGNRLQYYAVMKTIEQHYKCSVYGIDVIDNTIKYLVYKCNMTGIINKLIPKNKINAVRWYSFESFNRKNINYHYYKRNENTLSSVADKYDYFVCGSDQVWNPNWYLKDVVKKEMFLLSFAGAKQKVCFSPSFGITELPDAWKEHFKKYLSDIPNISVREEAGAKIVKELTGKEATVLIDPTLMLSKEDWLKIAEQPKRIDCDVKYVFTYFLGEKSDRVKNQIQALKEQGYTIYNLNDKTAPELYVLNPSHFIYMLSRAQLILTDSFHACVFSFIFEKPFEVYNRQGTQNNIMSRMDTLLKKFDLERKYIDSGLENDLFESNYENGKRQLKIEQKKVYDFLKMSFDK